jgi:transposase-like protein
MPRSSPLLIELSPAEREALESASHRYTASYRDVVRARIVLYAAAGAENREIARRLELPVQVVSKWRKRFFLERIAGLAERPRTGRPPAFPPSARGRGQGDRV